MSLANGEECCRPRRPATADLSLSAAASTLICSFVRFFFLFFSSLQYVVPVCSHRFSIRWRKFCWLGSLLDCCCVRLQRHLHLSRLPLVLGCLREPFLLFIILMYSRALREDSQRTAQRYHLRRKLPAQCPLLHSS